MAHADSKPHMVVVNKFFNDEGCVVIVQVRDSKHESLVRVVVNTVNYKNKSLITALAQQAFEKIWSHQNTMPTPTPEVLQ